MAPREAGAVPPASSGHAGTTDDDREAMERAAVVVALSTGSAYTYGLGRVFRMAAEAGYEGVEVIVDERWDTRQPAYLDRLVRETGVEVCSVHGPFPSQRIAGWPADEVGRVSEAIRLCEAVGARVLNLHLPERFRVATITARGQRLLVPIGSTSPTMRRFAAWLTTGGLEEAQAATAVRIVVENMPVRRILGRRVHAHLFNQWASFHRFGAVCLDTTHLGTTGSDLLEVAARLGPRIMHVHLSDFDGRNQHLLPGRGNLPLEWFVQWLGRRRFAGAIVVELSPHSLSAHDEGRLVAEFARAREFVAGAYAAGATVDAPESAPAALPGRAPRADARTVA